MKLTSSLDRITANSFLPRITLKSSRGDNSFQIPNQRRQNSKQTKQYRQSRNKDISF